MPSLTVDGWEFAYSDTGSGPPVVLLHGILMSRAMWDHQVASLADAYRVVTIDAPGHGESPPREGFTLEDEAAALSKFADAIGLGRAVWGGQSMGGFKSLRIALAEPERVAALVLVDSSGAEENPDLAPQYYAMLDVAKTDGVSDDLAGVIASIMIGPEALTTEEGVHWTKHFASLDGHAIDGTAHAVFGRRSVMDDISAITAPTLVVHGTEDVPIPIEIGRETARRIAGAEFVEIPGAGHTSPVEKPVEVTATIRDFLDRVTA